ncbi:hypothetical protein SEA_WHEEZY_91 [Gordonia phage Wheezy]|nr:hypothetical protein SEA_WHEEZY_91 [Gordonia phage Wheezy]
MCALCGCRVCGWISGSVVESGCAARERESVAVLDAGKASG